MDLEIRILVDEGAAVTVSSLEIQPIHNAKATPDISVARRADVPADITSNAEVDS